MCAGLTPLVPAPTSVRALSPLPHTRVRKKKSGDKHVLITFASFRYLASSLFWCALCNLFCTRAFALFRSTVVWLEMACRNLFGDCVVRFDMMLFLWLSRDDSCKPGVLLAVVWGFVGSCNCSRCCVFRFCSHSFVLFVVLLPLMCAFVFCVRVLVTVWLVMFSHLWHLRVLVVMVPCLHDH